MTVNCESQCLPIATRPYKFDCTSGCSIKFSITGVLVTNCRVKTLLRIRTH